MSGCAIKSTEISAADCQLIGEMLKEAFGTIRLTGRTGLIALYDDLLLIDKARISSTFYDNFHDVVVSEVAGLGVPIVQETEHTFAEKKNELNGTLCFVSLRYRDIAAFNHYAAVIKYTVTETKVIVKITRNKLGESGITFEKDRSNEVKPILNSKQTHKQPDIACAVLATLVKYPNFTTAKQVAEVCGIGANYVTLSIFHLRKAGILSLERGVSCSITRPPEEISLYDIYRVYKGDFSEIALIENTLKEAYKKITLADLINNLFPGV